MKLKTLCTVFPSDAVTASFAGLKQVAVVKHIFKSTYLIAALNTVGLAFAFTVLVSSFSSAHNKKYSLSVQISCRVPSNLRNRYT